MAAAEPSLRAYPAGVSSRLGGYLADNDWLTIECGGTRIGLGVRARKLIEVGDCRGVTVTWPPPGGLDFEALAQ
jgi:hypothetical protein